MNPANALTVFLVSVAFCAYTMAGYPLLLAVWARLRNHPVHKAPLETTVSIILPVHNGERWVGAKLESILAMHYPKELVEILVADDGSTDRTRSIVEQFSGRAKLQLLALPRGGKAAALNASIEKATGEILFLTDVRQTLHPDSLTNLVACFSDPRVGVASGELVIRKANSTEEDTVGLYWKYEKWIRKQLSRIDSVPGATGCIYAMRRRLARPMPVGTLVDDMYMPIGAFFDGHRVILDDSALAFDYPTQLGDEFRRKVRTLAGVYQVMGQYPALLGPRNRMWIHFVSHKLARLLMPWAILAALAVTYYLPSPWNYWAALAQMLGYGLALLDYVLPMGSPLKRITAPPRTFLVLMAASACAVSILFVPAHLLWGQTRVSD